MFEYEKKTEMINRVGGGDTDTHLIDMKAEATAEQLRQLWATVDNLKLTQVPLLQTRVANLARQLKALQDTLKQHEDLTVRAERASSFSLLAMAATLLMTVFCIAILISVAFLGG